MNLFRRLYSFDDDVDFRIGWRVAFILSAILLVLGGFSLGFRGLELGIDFRGGTAWQFPAAGTSTDTVRGALESVGAGDARIQTLNQGEDATIRVEVGTDVKAPEAVAAMAKATGKSTSVISANQSEVGPSWGANVSRSALRALVVFFIAIAVYISWQLEWRMAVSAIVAVLHDVFLSVAVYAIFRFEVTPGTVIAFLTILGYSLYDTIVVYDKVKDNEGRLTLQGDMTYTDMMNLSLNQTFMRSINTTLAAVLPVAAILFIGAGLMGAVTLEEFGLALFVGLILGAYSSVFIAAPIVCWLKEREPRNTQIRENVLARRAKTVDPVTDRPSGGAAAGEDEIPGDADTLEPVGSEPPASTASRRTGRPTSPYSDKHPPRPRKQGKKR
jgi:preprotein translocase subunit SecF